MKTLLLAFILAGLIFTVHTQDNVTAENATAPGNATIVPSSANQTGGENKTAGGNATQPNATAQANASIISNETLYSNRTVSANEKQIFNDTEAAQFASLSQIEQTLKLQEKYGYSLNPSFIPLYAASVLVPYFRYFRNQSKNLIDLGVAMANKQNTANQISNITALGEDWQNLENYVQLVYYPSFEEFIFSLEYVLGQKQSCLKRFNYIDLEIYVGTLRLLRYFFNTNATLDNVLQQDLKRFCEKERANVEAGLTDLFALLSGTTLSRVQSCDLLQDMYEGFTSMDIHTGWRDQMANKVAYILLDANAALVLISACRQITGASDVSTSVLNQYESGYQSVIDRILSFDLEAQSTIEETVIDNVQQMIENYDNVSLENMAVSIDFKLPSIYPQFRWFILVFESNASASDYAISCWHCVQLIDYLGYNVVVAWIDPNTTSSVVTLPSNITLEGTSDTYVDQVYNQTSCISGVVALNPSVKYYTMNEMGDRYVNITGIAPQNEAWNIHVWGVNEECLGKNMNKTS